MVDMKSVLKPENSMVAGLAVIGLVIATYNLHNGTAGEVAATSAWHPSTVTTNKKAGWTSMVLVCGVSLLAKDVNIFILGCSTIIAMHVSYIHAIAVHPATGQMVGAAQSSAYLPAAA